MNPTCLKQSCLVICIQKCPHLTKYGKKSSIFNSPSLERHFHRAVLHNEHIVRSSRPEVSNSLLSKGHTQLSLTSGGSDHNLAIKTSTNSFWVKNSYWKYVQLTSYKTAEKPILWELQPLSQFLHSDKKNYRTKQCSSNIKPETLHPLSTLTVQKISPVCSFQLVWSVVSGQYKGFPAP